MLDHIDKNIYIHIRVLTRMIAKNYFIILVLYYLFIDHGIFGIYIRHSMLDFLMEKMSLLYQELHFLLLSYLYLYILFYSVIF